VRSIRAFLLTRLVGGTALVLAVAASGVYFAVARSLAAQFDRNLSDRIQGLASLLFQQEDEVEFEFSGQLMPEYERAQAPEYFELRYDDGELLERSESLRGSDLALPDAVGEETVHWSAALPDRRPGRYAARTVDVHHVYPEEGPGRPVARRVVIAVARGREELVHAERAVLLQVAAASLAVLGLVAVLCWRTVARGLASTNRLARALEAIEVARLPEHIDAGGLPRELEPMARKTEELVRRLGAALERERRTTADIAHELRTPISELITVSEVALRNGRDPDATRRALGTLHDVAWHMGRSVSTLLKLARLEMGAETFAHRSVDLSSLVRELLRALASVGREREIAVEDRVGPGERVEGDEDVLRIVLSNLLSNALYYSPPRSTVVCSLERAGHDWRFVVENDAPELRPADLRALSEPFWRKDRARTDRDRSGLGLALSRALAERARMTLVFELAGARFRAILGPVHRREGREEQAVEDPRTARPSGAERAS
jgi:signal transduction histidine kinase